MKTAIRSLGIFAAFAAAAFLFSVHLPSAGAASPGAAITGYLWSDTIGWIDLSCSNSGTCVTRPFGLSVVSNSNGLITGYAWSDNVGWVSANTGDLSGCPVSPCEARITGNNVDGWLKVISANGSQSGGWDGFIRLDAYTPGVSFSNATKQFSGYAWGDTNIGWVDFSQASSNFGACTPSYSCNGNDIIYTDSSCNTSVVTTCVPPAFCSPGSSTCLYPQPVAVKHLTATPALVAHGDTTRISWNISNVKSCVVTGNGDSWTGASSAGVTSRPIMGITTYSLSCIALDDAPYVESTTVNVLPVYRER